MNNTEIVDLICQRLQDAAAARGAGRIEVSGETAILGGALPVDSLDLAAIVVELESVTGRDPFRDGFINFRTVGELARMYSEAE
jgi:acyl carrier protein